MKNGLRKTQQEKIINLIVLFFNQFNPESGNFGLSNLG